MPVDCTSPDELLAAVPCISQMSQNELWQVLVGALANSLGVAVENVYENSVKFRNMGDVDIMRAMIGATVDDASAYCEALQEGNALAGCLRCRSTQELKAMFLWMWCDSLAP